MPRLSPKRPARAKSPFEASPLIAKFQPRESAGGRAVEVAPPDQVEIEEETTPEEQVLELIDRIEDDWDVATYEDLVPLEIRLAVEDKIFGWNHLTSNVLGHLVFTLGAFLIVYVIVWYPTEKFQMIWARWLASLTAAISSFRMVRRRRQVYFRAAYGTRAYREDETRRQRDVNEADKTSWLGRIRKRGKRRKVQRALNKAEARFSAHHSNRQVLAAENAALIPIRRRPSFQTNDVLEMQSVQHDQHRFAHGPINNMLYTHGGFFGAAPFLLANAHWISILRYLQPDVYVEVARRVNAPPERLIHWAENNPVVAAYGTAHELEFHGEMRNIEWDVFVNPALSNRVYKILQKRKEFLDTFRPELVDLKPLQTISESQEMPQDARNILRYYDKQLHLGVLELVDKMLIAHGKLVHLLLEQTGFAKNYTHSRVRRTRRTLGGGIYAKQWLSLFAESLRIGVLDDIPTNSQEREEAKDCLFHVPLSSCPTTSMATSVETIRAITKKDDPIGLVLDVKSRHIPKEIWACVVDTLRSSGVRVEGIGSFITADIRGVNEFTLSPVREILFFHSAGDMQAACHNGSIQENDTVFFNAGSLVGQPALRDDPSLLSKMRHACSTFDPLAAKDGYQILSHGKTSNPEDRDVDRTDFSSSTIEHYKRRFNLSIGLYVQEFAIDEKAVDLLVQLVNRGSHVYDLGLNWGGINGITVRGIQPGKYTATDGFW